LFTHLIAALQTEWSDIGVGRTQRASLYAGSMRAPTMEGRGRERVSAAEPPPIESLQWLRFIAATFVVLYHIETQLFGLIEGHENRFGLGAAGVDLFFVISGFIMVYITYGLPTRPSSFLLRRLVRIAPLYWLFTLLILTLVVLAPGLFNAAQYDFGHVVSSFLFVPYAHPTLQVQRPLLVPGWTLNYEIFFYLLFASFMWLSIGLRIVTMAGTLGLLSGGRWLSGDGLQWLEFYGSPIVFEFVFGMAIGWVYFKCKSLPAGLTAWIIGFGILMFAGGIAAGISEQESRVIYWGLGAAGVVLGCLFIERSAGWPRIGLFHHFGAASYSLYLSHLFVLGAIAVLIEELGAAAWLGADGVRILMLAAALAAGSAVFVWIERPMHDRLKRELSQRARRQSVARGGAVGRTSAPEAGID
jgi:exopolysaccharide production protein ExoZ